MNENLRPGVYSSYTTSYAYGTPRTQKGAALICEVAGNPEGRRYAIKSYPEAAALLGGNSYNKVALVCCRLLLESGLPEVNIVTLGDNIKEVCRVVEEIANIGVIVCDEMTNDEQKAMLASAVKSSGKGEERLCFFASDPDFALENAKGLNSERGIVCTPKSDCDGVSASIITACAMAAATTGRKPNYNLSGAELKGVTAGRTLKEDDIQLMIKNGVSVCENIGDSCRWVRAVTTRTTTAGMADGAFRSVNTVMIIDDVMSAIRRSLGAKLSGNGETTLDSVASQVIVELEAKRKEGVIREFSLPRVYPDSADPAVCIVELGFGVAHVINQIYITAHIGL